MYKTKNAMSNFYKTNKKLIASNNRKCALLCEVPWAHLKHAGIKNYRAHREMKSNEKEKKKLITNYA